MANIIENTANPAWSTGIYQIETSDPVLGGANGIANRQAKELAARTQWLKTEIARTIALIGTNQTAADQKYALKTTQINAGAGLTGGGLLRDNSTISMGTPSKITATSQNSAVSNTHTHEIDKASTSIAGIVRLSSATDSTAENLAATPKAVKQLADLIGATGSASFPQRGALGGRNLNDLHGAANYGIWYQGANANASASLNYPVQVAGTLFVLPSAYAGVQLYIPFDRFEIHIRNTYHDNSWSSWRINGEVVNALTSGSTTAALSAAQGKALHRQITDLNSDAVVKTGEAASLDAAWGENSIRHIYNGGGNAGFPTGAYTYGVLASFSSGNARSQMYLSHVGDVWVRGAFVGSSVHDWRRLDGADWGDIRNKPNLNAPKDMRSAVPDLSPAVLFQNATPAQLPLGIYMGLSGNAGLDGGGNGVMTTVKAWGDASGRYAIYREGRLPNGEIWRQYANDNLSGWLPRVRVDGADWRAVRDKPTTLSGYGITDGVTPAQLQAAVAGIVSSSPAALDTLRELAAALGNDPNYAATTARKLGEAAPSGTVAWFAGNTAPAGWLKANGAAVSRTAYAALFAAIGTTYGTGDGRTTFSLPDLRGEFVRGWDDGRGIDIGRVFGWRQGDAIRNITGTLDTGAESNLQFVDYAESSGAFGILRRYKRWTSDAGGGNDAPSGFNFDASRVVPTASENRPRNVALLGIIKI